MRTISLNGPIHLVCAVALAGILGGCARQAGIHAVYEERYRLLFIKDQATPERIATDPEAAGRVFAPMASLNRSFDDLAKEGFQLVRVAPVGDGGGATQFVFRRLIPQGYKTTNAPMELSGIFRYQDTESGGSPVYYVFDPLPGGYTVRVTSADLDDRTFEARWDGNQLCWRDGDFENRAVLSGDGRTVVQTSVKLLIGKDEIETQQIEAYRLERTVQGKK